MERSELEDLKTEVKALRSVIEFLKLEIEDIRSKITKPKKKAPVGKEIWEYWSFHYHERYGVIPVRNAMVNKLISNLISRLGIDRSKTAIDSYLKDHDRFLIKNHHHIKFLVANCESYIIASQHKIVSRTEAEQVEKTSGTSSAVDNYLEKKRGGPRDLNTRDV